MDTALLRRAGLTESQAKGYLALIEYGSLSPVELAEKTGESRTNGYMVADKLVELGLATKKEGPKALYVAAHPSALEALAEKRRKAVQANEQIVKHGLGDLIDYYNEYAERPGVRYLEGREGLKKIYDDILKTKETLEIVRTPNEKKYFEGELFENFVAERIRLNIALRALTPFTDRANTDPKKDERNLLKRQFFPEDMYTAPVEIDVYGQKVGFISFGEELAGVIVENQHIADAMRELLALARIGAERAFADRPELVKKLANARQAHTTTQSGTPGETP